MKKLVIFVLCFFLIGCCFSEEISRTEGVGIDNVQITTVKYKNEKDGLVKVVYYGKLPQYKNKIMFFVESNKDCYERREYYNYHYLSSESKDGIPEYAIYYLRSNNPYHETQVDLSYRDGIISSKHYYIPANEENLLYKIIDTTSDNKILKKEKIYALDEKTKDHIKDYTWIYNSDNEVVKTIAVFFPNSEGKVDQVDEYSPPLFSQKNNNSFKTVFTYSNNPDGCLQQTILYDGKGGEVDSIMYNANQTDKGYTRVINFYKNDVLLRQVQYFDDKLFRGKIYLISIYYNNDGTIKASQYFDKDEKEIRSEDL